MFKQRTLRQSVETVGIGLHSGRKVHLVLRPAEPDTGILYRRVDIRPAVEIPAHPLNVNDTRMATTVNVGKAAVATIEHLMSAFNGLGIDNVIIEVDSAEIPIMDGSGASFVFLLHQAGIVEQDAPKRFVRVLKPVEVREGDKLARLEPHEGFRLTFTIAFGHPAIDRTEQKADVDFSRVTYEQAVSRARTFGFVQDAMGDLYVLGHPLLAHYVAHKSGHGLNNQLLRALLADETAWEWATFDKAEDCPVDFWTQKTDQVRP